VALNKNYVDKPLDFFYFHGLLSGAVITEKLKRELEQEEITGLDKFMTL
jgi:hypothetical protein